MQKTINKHYWFVALIVYFVSRIIAYSVGVRFDSEPLQYFWQYLDPELLSQNLVTSVYYQHSQPPLFNLFIGTLIQAFPTFHPWVFAFIFHGCSLIIYGLMFYLLVASGINTTLALVVASVFIISPEAILYENMLFYTWPIAALLMIIAFCVFKYDHTHQRRYAISFLVLIAVLCLSRSMFHLIYLFACTVFILLFQKTHRKILIGVGLAAILITSSVYIKNWVVFDFFGASSWTGMNVWRIVNAFDSATENSDSPLAKIQPFSPLTDYPELYQQVPEQFLSIPALSSPKKSNGDINFNHYGYLTLSKDYMALAKNQVQQDPVQYLKHMARAWLNYTEPAWIYRHLRSNSQHIKPYIELFGLHTILNYLEDDVLKLDQELVFNQPLLSCVPVMLAIIIIISSTLCRAPNLWQSMDAMHGQWLFCFIVMTLGYTAILGNALEFGENNRFRVQTDPLIIIGVVLSLQQLWQRRHQNY